MSGRERRGSQRAPFDGWVEITASGARHRARAVDLSEGGIGVSYPGRVPVGNPRLVSEFALPGISLPLALESEVVWTDAPSSRMGIRFRAVDPGLEELLRRFAHDHA